MYITQKLSKIRIFLSVLLSVCLLTLFTPSQIALASANSGPVVTTSSGSTVFPYSAVPDVVVDPGITVLDTSSTTLTSVTVSITSGFDSSEDTLLFTSTGAAFGNITGSYTKGVLTLTSAGASATLAEWQAVLQSIKFSSSTTSQGTRTIAFTVNDAVGMSATAAKEIDISNPASLTQLSLSAKSGTPTLSPNFSPSTTTYNTSVAYNVSQLTVTPTAAFSGDTLTVNKSTDTSGSPVTVNLGVGTNPISIVVTWTGGKSMTYAINVERSTPTFSFSPTTLPTGIVGSEYNATITANGAISPSYTITSGSLPAGLSLSASGILSGTPTTTGTYSFTVTAMSSDNFTGSQNYNMTTIAEPVVTTSSGPTTDQGSAPVFVDPGLSVTDPGASPLESAMVSITGGFHSGEDKLDFENNGSTMGNIACSFDAITGVLTLTSSGATATIAEWQTALRAVTYADTAGTPTISNRTISFIVSDGTNNSDTVTKTVQVFAPLSNNANLSTLTLSTGSLSPTFTPSVTNYTTTVTYGVTIAAITPTTQSSSATFTINGLTAANGSTFDTSLNVGSNTIAIQVKAQNGVTKQTYTVTVVREQVPTIVLNSPPIADGTVGTAYNASFTASGGKGPYSYSVSSGNLPAGLSLSATAGTLSGIPTTAGAFTFTVQATDADGHSGQLTYTLTINPIPPIYNTGGNHGRTGTGSITGSTPPVNGPSSELPTLLSQQFVGPTGGTWSVPCSNSMLTIQVPAGAFNSPETVYVTTSNAADLSSKFSGLSSQRIGELFGISYSGVAPTQPITVSMGNPNMPQSVVVYALNLNNDLNSLTPVKSVLSSDNLQVSLTSASDFVILTKKPSERVITLGNRVMIVPSVVMNDSGQQTTGMPIWYVMHLMKTMGIESIWNGHDWSLTTPSTSQPANGQWAGTQLKTGNTHLYLNGVLVQTMNTTAQLDPSANQLTTYMPIWYVMQLLNHLNVNNAWDGTTWTVQG